MVKLTGLKKLYSGTVVRRFGSYCELGTMLSGKTMYGAETIKVNMGKYGEVELSGIYQRRHSKGRVIYVKERLYFPKYSNNEIQAAMRQKIRDAVLAWQGLTTEQKLVYNNRARGKARSGYNIFVKEYLLSH